MVIIIGVGLILSVVTSVILVMVRTFQQGKCLYIYVLPIDRSSTEHYLMAERLYYLIESKSSHLS